MKVDDLKSILSRKRQKRDQLTGMLNGEIKRLKERGCSDEEQAEKEMDYLNKKILQAMDEIQEGINSIEKAYDLD